MAGVQSLESNHPYVPTNLILPDYVPIILSQSTILGVFGSASFLVLSFVWIIAGQFPKISKLDKILMCWWVFTGLIHMILEGYYVFTPDFYKQKNPTFLAEVWKENSKGDSRYIARDSTIVALELITSIAAGPACLVAVYAISARKPYSHLLQIAIALGQLYGTAVYFITSYLEGDDFAISPYYYYSYYIFANLIWVLIPSLIVIRSWKKTSAAIHIQEQKKTTTH